MSIQMENSTRVWTKEELIRNIDRIEQVLNQACFKRDATYTSLTQSSFIKLIGLEKELLEQTQQAGKRIDFLDEVGTNGRIEDITSLVTGMSQLIDNFDQVQRDRIHEEPVFASQINHFYGAGVGYFSNGLFFICNYEDELAFFVGSSRILFYRHLVRAFDEAKSYLQSAIIN